MLFSVKNISDLENRDFFHKSALFISTCNGYYRRNKYAFLSFYPFNL